MENGTISSSHKRKNNLVTVPYWFYGHFHESWHSEIEGVRYNMLDIMELREFK